MRRRLGYALVGVLALAAVAPIAAQAQGTLRQIPVDDEFAKGEFTWRGLPGGYFYRAKIVVVDGIIELCGVGAFTNITSRPAATKMLRGAKLMLNGRPILEGFYYFNSVATKQQLDSAKAYCKSTGARLPRNPEFDIDLPSGDFRG